MKKLLALIVKFILFLILDVVGSLFYHPFHVRTALSGNPLEPRMYVWDGILLMLVAYLLLLLIAVLRRRIATSVRWSTLALLLAAAAGYALKLGFVTQNW